MLGVMNVNEQTMLNRFEIERDRYIQQLEDGQINKKEFIERNMRLFDSLNLRPFSQLDTYKKALYNYQYYNIRAKEYIIKMHQRDRKGKQSRAIENMIRNSYCEKDRAIISLLQICPKDHIIAYPIKTHSTKLHLKLIEIVITNRKFAVFHTKNEEVIKRLRSLECFDEDERNSVIDSYVNTGFQ